MSKRILIIDDDVLLRRSLGFNLEKAGFDVFTAATAEDGLLIAQQQPPDLILLDINMPGMDGLDALKHFREQTKAPVIFVTARRRELDEILGLELGADDYVTKPFDFDVLLARIKATLRRANPPSVDTSPASTLEIGDIRIDPGAHTVSISGKEIDLSPKEFDLLYALALNAGKVVSADELIARVWGAEFEGEPQALYVHIRWLREKLEEDPNRPRHILTVRGVGYKLV
ncbi:response regulators consisting of a CheY-like receiver domain and a winged-helix DNA-binding domain [Anaerolinea thermolimosa]|uniref:response regulator transcription factor n=1 Tax=Anaerolinea thermolimosa TaxID=229919 RepID=UPI0007857FD7|nr:response regulator transcription factor [Anaerolinea thermolimosa]GAP07247.1 response regulators consisting of a CheY-like receiver domain and a winged-helix DNA-binding domain [Anaerolinea thermolimosa]